MRVLWITNFIPPVIASKLGFAGNNKEGWVAGLMNSLTNRHETGTEIELSVAAPVPEDLIEGYYDNFDGVDFYGFHEDPAGVEYNEELEKTLCEIAEKAHADVIHVFGTEYPHARALLEGIDKYSKSYDLSLNRVLIGMQGVVGEITYHYFDGLPGEVTSHDTFRDMLKNDGLLAQRNKFVSRANNEMIALSLAKNVTGRTPFDKEYVSKWARSAVYYSMNETLRPEFYDGVWDSSKAKEHSIFLSQANYPIKGMHNVLKALPLILKKYPDTTVRVAGDSITKHKSLKDKIKISGYGKYLVKLEKDVYKECGFAPSIEYLGPLTAEQMKEEYLKASLFLCPSTNENSPNSLGEAMLLGVPCVASNVGGIPGMMTDRIEGLLFEALDAEAMFSCIDSVWSDISLRDRLCEAAKKRAEETHDADRNFNRLLEIYREISGKEV
ncbi:MAG: glycosyltransferase family 4 protein [Lachnospiraceae bacterium]|nr:glycosyltransferase family 4 protein [Lachnospiraceae bacterium]